MLKKILPLSIVAIYLAVPAFAEDTPDISSTDDGVGMCVEPVLGTYTGPANLQADWKGNEIDIRWYNNNSLIIPTNTAANGCVYGTTTGTGALTVPATAPTRVGYTFNGWTIRPLINFATAIPSGNGTGNYGKGIYNNKDYCGTYYDSQWHEGGPAFCLSDSNFTELQQQEWKTTFSHGTLYGMAKCSAKAGDNHSYAWGGTVSDWQATDAQLDAVSGDKKYCYCKATGYKASSATEVSGPESSLSWVFFYASGSAAYCAANCASGCANYAQYYSAFRAALFTPSN